MKNLQKRWKQYLASYDELRNILDSVKTELETIGTSGKTVAQQEGAKNMLSSLNGNLIHSYRGIRNQNDQFTTFVSQLSNLPLSEPKLPINKIPPELNLTKDEIANVIRWLNTIRGRFISYNFYNGDISFGSAPNQGPFAYITTNYDNRSTLKKIYTLLKSTDRAKTHVIYNVFLKLGFDLQIKPEYDKLYFLKK